LIWSGEAGHSDQRDDGTQHPRASSAQAPQAHASTDWAPSDAVESWSSNRGVAANGDTSERHPHSTRQVYAASEPESPAGEDLSGRPYATEDSMQVPPARMHSDIALTTAFGFSPITTAGEAIGPVASPPNQCSTERSLSVKIRKHGCRSSCRRQRAWKRR
jgi:hypothetical protein